MEAPKSNEMKCNNVFLFCFQAMEMGENYRSQSEKLSSFQLKYMWNISENIAAKVL